MPRRLAALLLSSLALGFVACSSSPPRDQNDPEAGAGYEVHPREVRPDLSAAAGTTGTAGTTGAAGATGAAGTEADAATDSAAD
jgi:hypothetical protein